MTGRPAGRPASRASPGGRTASTARSRAWSTASASPASAAARRASAVTAATSARSAWRNGQEPSEGGGHHQQRDGRDQSAPTPSGSAFPPRLGVGVTPGVVEEVPFGRGEGGMGSLLPVQGGAEPDSPVQLGVGAAHRVPRVGGAGEVAEDPLAIRVVVEPALQAGPRPGQRLVRELDDTVVAGDQAGIDEQVDEVRRGRGRLGGCAGEPGVDTGSPSMLGPDQPQQQVAELGPAGRRAPVRTPPPRCARSHHGCRQWPGSRRP